MGKTIEISGFSVPTFIYGTAWKEDSTSRCVTQALEAGFRGIDTANQRKHYFEVGVGAALSEAYKKGYVARKDLFLQTKFTYVDGQDHRLPYDPAADSATQVRQSFQSSLEHLGTEYLDSYVLHGPSTRSGLTDEDWTVWRAMERLSEEGRARLLGISNVSAFQLQLLCEGCSIKPAFVQNRCFAISGWDFEVRRICKERGMHYQGFSLLTANPAVPRDLRFQALCNRYKCTSAQLIFSFALQRGMLPLTGSTNRSHLEEDLGAYQITLSEEELSLIETISQ